MARRTPTASAAPTPWKTPAITSSSSSSSSRFFPSHKLSSTHSRMSYRSWEEKTPEPLQSPPFDTAAATAAGSTLLRQENQTFEQLQLLHGKESKDGIRSSKHLLGDSKTTSTRTAPYSFTSHRSVTNTNTPGGGPRGSPRAKSSPGIYSRRPQGSTTKALSTSELEALSPRYAAIRAARLSPEKKSPQVKSPGETNRTRFSPESRNTEISGITTFTTREAAPNKSSPRHVSYSAFGRENNDDLLWETKSKEEKTFSPYKSARKSPYFPTTPQNAAARERVYETNASRTKPDIVVNKILSTDRSSPNTRELSSYRPKFSGRSPRNGLSVYEGVDQPLGASPTANKSPRHALGSTTSSLVSKPSTKIDEELLRAKHLPGGPTRGEQFVVELCELLELDVGHHVFLANVMDEQVFNKAHT